MRFFALLPFIAFLFVSCSGGSGSALTDSPFTAILVTDVGGLGDKGFNDSGWAGCQDAQRRLAEQGVTLDIHVIQSREQTDYAGNLDLAAEKADIVIGLGFLISDAIDAASQRHPETQFLLIDGRVDGPNVASYEFRAEEGGFLAGVLSTLVTRSGRVGVLPGMDIPPVRRFAAGYRAGIQFANELRGSSIEALTVVIGSFNDPVKGKSLARSLLDQNADILFQLAGNSGLGVIEAVKDLDGQAPPYVIGVDIDQDDLLPGRILTSVLKRMDRVVSDKIIAAYESRFESGHYLVGLSEGYVGLTEMAHTRNAVDESGFQLLDRVSEAIAAGEIEVPSNYEALQNYQAPVERFRE